MSEASKDPAVVRPLDLSEKGRRGKEVISLNRRLFMKFTAFTDVEDTRRAIKALEDTGLTAAIYADINDPYGIGVMVASEDPSAFVTTLRDAFNSDPFDVYDYKPEFDMLGRSYSIGYEPDLEETLITRPLTKLVDPRNEWVVWYPLQRSKGFYVLPEERQKSILG
ncbi:MAG: hypothetical protein PVH89_10490, partial [Gammaproteobacteria bacterium]